MLSPTAVSPAAQAVPRPKQPTAVLLDGPLDITVFDVLDLHELFERARALLGPIIVEHRVRSLSLVVRARNALRGGGPAVEVEGQVRASGQPISIRCVRPDARAAIELCAIVLRLRLTSSDQQLEARP